MKKLFVLVIFSVFMFAACDTSQTEENIMQTDDSTDETQDSDYSGSDWMGGDDIKPEINEKDNEVSDEDLPDETADGSYAEGDTGDTGNTADTGDAGNTGNTVDTGDSGDTANTGGDTGNTGNTADTGDIGDTGDTGNTGVTPQPGQITAAEWSDLDNWDFWTNLLEDTTFSEYTSRWGIHSFQKVSVTVVDNDKVAIDAHVKLVYNSEDLLWTARTNNSGIAHLFVTPYSTEEFEGDYSIEVTYDGETKSSPFDGTEEISFEFDTEKDDINTLDLMFMVDTTGSMSDELSYLKAELSDVIDQVFEEYANSLTLRLSCNFYRDFGDEYVVRFFPFTSDIEAVQESLERQSASGGGDRPEGVHMALDNAINMHEWSENARARIVFLILDAPPHIEDQGVAESIRNSIQDAAEKGIRIIPIAASGIDQSDEFLLRSMDILSGGTYIFITDDSGIGGGHSIPTVGEYQIDYLNNLIVKVIGDYLE